jgi:hypothetical protein
MGELRHSMFGFWLGGRTSSSVGVFAARQKESNHHNPTRDGLLL